MVSNLSRATSARLLFHTQISFGANLLIIIGQLLESVFLCPKVILLSGFQSNKKVYKIQIIRNGDIFKQSRIMGSISLLGQSINGIKFIQSDKY